MKDFIPASNKVYLYKQFEKLYLDYNRIEFVHPDPLEFVLRFTDRADQEIAGLIASGLAYGRVGQILSSLERIFSVLNRPSVALANLSRKDLMDALGDFRHRWSTGEEVVDLLNGISILREEYGSLERCFLKGLKRDDPDVINSLAAFVERLHLASGRRASSLLASPSQGSACKRMFLYLRWMVRNDVVDPGTWESISSAKLIVPMDVHMHRVSHRLGLTSRRQADLKSALQVTCFFRHLVPEDPVKYDFTLTRPGIRPDMDNSVVFDRFQAENLHLC